MRDSAVIGVEIGFDFGVVWLEFGHPRFLIEFGLLPAAFDSSAIVDVVALLFPSVAEVATLDSAVEAARLLFPLLLSDPSGTASAA